MQWTNDQPIYQQVRDHVVSLIIDNVLKSGDPIPSVRQMAICLTEGIGSPDLRTLSMIRETTWSLTCWYMG